MLIEQVKGDYIVFVDDDRIEPHYVSTLCAQIESVPQVDCIVFDVAVYFNGRFNKLSKYGNEYSHGEDHFFYYRKPNHIMCYAKRIAAKHKFNDISFGEDDNSLCFISLRLCSYPTNELVLVKRIESE